MKIYAFRSDIKKPAGYSDSYFKVNSKIFHEIPLTIINILPFVDRDEECIYGSGILGDKHTDIVFVYGLVVAESKDRALLFIKKSHSFFINQRNDIFQKKNANKSKCEKGEMILPLFTIQSNMDLTL